MRRLAALWRARPSWGVMGLCLLAGLGLALGMKPFDLWWLALAALGLALAVIAAQPRPGAAAWAGFAFGLGHFALALDWIVEPFFVDAATYGWMAPFAVAGMAAGMALFWALAAGLAALSRWRMLALVTSLSAAELARAYVLTGFPWAAPGQIWIDTPPAQVLALIGPNGLTAMTLAVAGLWALRRWQGFAAGLAIVAAAWVWGDARLSAPDPAAPGAVVRLVQPNAAQDIKWDPDHAAEIFDRLLTETAADPAPGQTRPDLVIWPETALPYSIEAEPDLTSIIAAAGRGAMVALGRQRIVGDQGWNTLTVLDGAGGTVASYDKHHLVPFGEYIPFGDLAYDIFGLRAFASQTGHAYSAGTGAAVLRLGTRLGTVLPLICYEAVFPQDVRAAPARADWILQVTNDAWFGTFSGPFQHEAQARMRAIESGLPLVRVGNTGVTEVADAKGRVLAALPFGIAAHLDVALPGAMAMPPYQWLGEGPTLVWLIGCGILCLWPFRRRNA